MTAPVMLDEDGKIVYDEYGDPVACLDGHGNGEGCSGPVEWWMTPSTWKSWPRCTKHGERRMEQDEQTRQRYPTMEPSDFDPSYAGERWNDDDV